MSIYLLHVSVDESSSLVDPNGPSINPMLVTSVRHVNLNGVELPWSRSQATYNFDSYGKLVRIQDSSDVPLGLAIPALSFAAPALASNSPLLTTLREASR